MTSAVDPQPLTGLVLTPAQQSLRKVLYIGIGIWVMLMFLFLAACIIIDWH